MSSTANYDQALLDEAPEVTAAQKQRFYDPELLYDKPAARSSKDKLDSSPTPAAAATTAHSDIEAGHTNGASRKEYTPIPPTKKVPFYRTRKGIIIIVIAAIVIVAAAVGGGVGGALGGKKSNNDNTTSSASAPVETTPSGGGGGGLGTGGGTTSQGAGVGTEPAASPTPSVPGLPGAPSTSPPATETGGVDGTLGSGGGPGAGTSPGVVGAEVQGEAMIGVGIGKV